MPHRTDELHQFKDRDSKASADGKSSKSSKPSKRAKLGKGVSPEASITLLNRGARSPSGQAVSRPALSRPQKAPVERIRRPHKKTMAGGGEVGGPPAFAPTMWLVKTDNLGASDDDQFSLFLQGALTYDFEVAWGDGNFDTYTTSGTKTHTYASIGEYIITMTPTGNDNSLLPHLGTGDAHKLLEIQAWGTMEWQTMVSSINNCINLILTAIDIPDTSNCTLFSSAFSGCVSITEIPLMDTSAGLSFSGAWQGCTGLTSFPALDFSSATNVASAWANCTNLTTFPALDFPNVTTCLDSWKACSGLLSFPATDFPVCTLFQTAWIDCSGLISFGLCTFGASADFDSAWRRCDSLLAFPAIDFTGALSFVNTWVDCDVLADFDAIEIAQSFSIAQCNLDGTALDNVYTNLPTATRTITVTGNPGTGSDNPAIATAKNWTVVGS